MTIFYICRHGQSEYNLQKRIQGQIDTPLTDLGIKNAETVAKKLSGVCFDYVFSSDLGRAFQTAYIIITKLHITKPIISCKFLREGNFGTLAGMSSAQVEEKYPGFSNDIYFIPPGGESLSQIKKRVLNFLIELDAKFPGKTILLVTHDQVINTICTWYEKVDLGTYNQKNYNAHDLVARFVIKKGEIISLIKLNGCNGKY